MSDLGAAFPPNDHSIGHAGKPLRSLDGELASAIDKNRFSNLSVLTD